MKEPTYENQDQLLWRLIRHSIDRNDFRGFLILYPLSSQAATARARLTYLIIDQVDEKTATAKDEAERVWQLISQTNNPKAIQRYLQAYGTRPPAALAKARLKLLCSKTK